MMYTSLYRLRLLLAAALTLSAITISAASWQTVAHRQIAAGEFTKTEQLLDKLSDKDKQRHAIAIDSLRQIMSRIRRDFSLTPDSGRQLIRQFMPEATEPLINHWIADKKIEVMNIDGQQWWFRKAVRNLRLLADEFANDNAKQKEATADVRRQQALEALAFPADRNAVRHRQRIEIQFTLNVNADAVPDGDTLRVWMPIPYENLRQSDIRITDANRNYTLSRNSKHHTVYMEAQAHAGQPTQFRYTFNYIVGERHLTQQDLLMMLEPYDTHSPQYRTFTDNQLPHIIKTQTMQRLAQQIVGTQQNPVLQAAMVYEWISHNFPWAGAREYSTIDNIPQYVLDNGHGDCGQVTLLYITLMRCLGIPARWESGYMLHPGEENYHDWAETYFEGIGWVPTDQSFGRSTIDSTMGLYYATGIDLYRMASNEDICMPLDPPKKFIRSETVDFQPGEVEWKGGNLFYDLWDSHLQVLSITPVEQ